MRIAKAKALVLADYVAEDPAGSYTEDSVMSLVRNDLTVAEVKSWSDDDISVQLRTAYLTLLDHKEAESYEREHGLIHSAWEPDTFVSDDDSDNFGGPRSTDVNRGAW